MVKRVAIGCQGGGMHAAFEVGVLTKILEELSEPEAGFELAGLSGTSAGALCALMAWYGLASKNGKSGSEVEASNTLNHFWEHFVATTGAESILNGLTRGVFRLEEAEVPVLGLSAARLGLNPCRAIYKAVAACLPHLGVRREYFDLDHVLKQACIDFDRIDWPKVKTRLLIGASEVVNGYETVFDSDLNRTNNPGEIENCWHQRLPLSLAGVAASGTLPAFREAQHIKGCGHYWDGLYSQNPPVREFVEERFDPQKREASPDELWILRINPQQWPRLCETHGEIEDRENELMGNLSLKKELDFVLKVNKWLNDDKHFQQQHAYKEIIVRTIKMRKETVDELFLSSKFDRSFAFMDRLRQEGHEVAEEWLTQWKAGVVGKYPEDAGYRL